MNGLLRPLVYLAALLWVGVFPVGAQPKPLLEQELIFPLDPQHNHSSSLVELPGGDLLVTWYRGSGERQADDVQLMAARKSPGGEWSAPFVLADTPGFPDANPVLFIDSQGRLWLIWPVILANEWHTALLKYRVTLEYPYAGSQPRWEIADNLLLLPKNFEERVREWVRPLLKEAKQEEHRKYLEGLIEKSENKYFRRMGWMPRTHPVELPSGRLLIPLYSDGFDFSLVAISDDLGQTWKSSEPLLGLGAVQPSIVRRRDGTLIAYFRDNGPPPKRILRSESADDGMTWTVAKDTAIPNPGSSVDVIALKTGEWVMAYNDTEKGRHSLAIALSEDEGRTWPHIRHLERDPRKEKASSYHYPSLIQTQDGTLHLTYSYFLNQLRDGAPRKSIKHARFNLDWIRGGQ